MQDKSINSLINEAYEVRLSSPSRFKEIVEHLLIQTNLSSSQINDTKLLHAYLNSYIGNYKKSESILEHVLQQTNLKPSVKLQSQYLMVYNMAAIKNWIKGFYYTKELIDSDILDSQKTLAANALIATITFLNQFEQFELALNQLEKLNGFELSPYNHCVSEQLKVLAKKSLGQLSIASLEIDESIRICSAANAPLLVNILRSYQADLFIKSGAPERAIGLLLPLIDDIRKIQYPMLTAGIYNYISEAYLALSNIEQAEKYAYLSVQEHKDQIADQAKDSYYLIYKINKRKHKYNTALEYFEKFARSEKAYLDEVSAKALAYQLAQHQAIQQKNQIELLNNQNELLNNRNELLRVEQSLARTEAENTKLIASLLMAIIALLAFFGYRSWRTQRRLKTLAEFDYLTNVYNRGHFMTLAEETLKLATKAKQTVTCIMFDLDKFKKINDQYGHSAGDLALKAAASAAHSCVRDNDIFARLGGEEFVILLPGCDTSAACYVAEKCMRAFEAIDTNDSGHDFSVTASFGITTSKISGMAIDDLIADADKALYQAKNNGRNQYRIYEP
ncbi:GGDEF domain-containing protein [Thalassotalea euphylliae]|uniref:diguanylate cyclase n=2 Tax=Thalassotalea euphylliae TaxID=1655234 RepID=A0A3E0UE18_9GAMM|nr:GGDEF domain-containing protein [Thalassotalea euphylliae]